MKQLWDTCEKDPVILHKRVPKSTPEDCEKAIAHIRGILSTHDSANCFGLAANQLGLNTRACLLTVPSHYFNDKKKKDNKKVEIEFHNPTIVEHSGRALNQEWCYSMQPEDSYMVQRHKDITIKDDKNDITKLSGVVAYAAQHEIDHLNGVTIRDKGKPSKDMMKILAKKPPKGPPKNAPCVCGSGKKYKRCCGK
jgi:peptide deformylase